MTATLWTCLCASPTRWRSACMRRRVRGAAWSRAPAHTAHAALQFGYSVYRQVIGYYSGEEDAYGARRGSRRVHATSPAAPLTHARRRHEEGDAARRAQEVHHPAQEACEAIRAGRRLMCKLGVASRTAAPATPRDKRRETPRDFHTPKRDNIIRCYVRGGERTCTKAGGGVRRASVRTGAAYSHFFAQISARSTTRWV